jgi:hypothetical protein
VAIETLGGPKIGFKFVLAITNGERAAQTHLPFDWFRGSPTDGAGLVAQDAYLMQLPDAERARYAKHQAAHWIALGCVSFEREAEMRGESKSKVEVCSFMYTTACNSLMKGSGALGSIATALQNSSQWLSDDKTTRDAERDAFSRIATSRLASGGQSLLPGFSVEEIRETLTFMSSD